MLKKRLIFTLLYSDGYFMLSRNFRLQKVGALNWLQQNYNFSQIAFSIDELIILDVTKGQRNQDLFCDHLKMIAKECFMPVAAGGGVRNIKDAKRLFASGADKIVVNTALFANPEEVKKIASMYGSQAIIASIDARQKGANYVVLTKNGEHRVEGSLSEVINVVVELGVGEIYLNSIDRDGTGQGLDISIMEFFPKSMPIPLILTGGVGKSIHFHEGLIDRRVDAVATAHLFNFVGDGLCHARDELLVSGVALPHWDKKATIKLRDVFLR